MIFKDKLEQATINSILSDLDDRLCGIEYEVRRDEINHIVSKIRNVLDAGFLHVKHEKRNANMSKVNRGSIKAVF